MFHCPLGVPRPGRDSTCANLLNRRACAGKKNKKQVKSKIIHAGQLDTGLAKRTVRGISSTQVPRARSPGVCLNTRPPKKQNTKKQIWRDSVRSEGWRAMQKNKVWDNTHPRPRSRRGRDGSYVLYRVVVAGVGISITVYGRGERLWRRSKSSRPLARLQPGLFGSMFSCPCGRISTSQRRTVRRLLDLQHISIFACKTIK